MAIFLLYFLKQKDHKLESAPTKETIELGKSETKFTMRDWVCAQIRDLKIDLVSMITKIEQDIKNEMVKMEERIDRKLDKIESSISSYKEEKHDQAERLNIKNMENQLLYERLEKSDRIIEQANIMTKTLEKIINDKA
jgi:hypothetical protein